MSIKMIFLLIHMQKELIISLNKQSGHYNWHLINSSETQLEARFYLINDIKISKTMFYRVIYQKLLQENWILSDTINKEKKDLKFQCSGKKKEKATSSSIIKSFLYSLI